MVWNNSIILFAFIFSTTTSSTNFSVLVSVVGSLDPSTYDPYSYTIIIPNWNSNGNPSIDFGILGGIYSSIGLNSLKANCVTTFSIYSSVACVCYCCYCKCCSKCCKCCGLTVVSIQSAYTFASKCRCSSPFGNLVSCSLLTP
jgi:hypothetical protein